MTHEEAMLLKHLGVILIACILGSTAAGFVIGRTYEAWKRRREWPR
jgi:hypothetical protein